MRLNETLARVSATALVVALSLAAPVAAQTDGIQLRSGVFDISRMRIENFGRVNTNYYRGAQPSGRDYADLAALGVKTLINLTSDDAEESEEMMAERAGMEYFQIPMTTHEPPTAAKLAAFLRIVDDPARQPVYVHCVGGRHRTGVMTAVYRMERDGWTAEQAFKEMKQFRFGADFLHSEFKRFVYGYRPEVVRNAAVPPIAASKTGD